MKIKIAWLALALAASSAPAMAGAGPAAHSQPARADNSCTDTSGCQPIQVQSQSRQPNRPVDCHRDVRTHRVNGVMLRHRHVGPNCQIREVRQSS